jgi:23S rRNA pseudouridine1911/1915/1917 synthase
MSPVRIMIFAEESGDRIDALLARKMEGITRSAAQRLLESGFVFINGAPVKKNHRVSHDEQIEVMLTESVVPSLKAQDIPLDVVYEDGDVIVVNKPRGMVVHPAPGHPEGTLVNALMHHCSSSLSGIGGERRPGIVHRIDKDTSGLIIAAKNDISHISLSKQLSDRSLSRIYEAIVIGRIRDDSGIIDAPIGRHPSDRKKMAVTEKNSRRAVTHYQVIARYNGYTHVRCMLETGRTHQIRVHMAYIGHPVLGDPVYGHSKTSEKGLSGQCLHARELKFIHPRTGEEIRLTSELPEYFTETLERLGNLCN